MHHNILSVAPSHKNRPGTQYLHNRYHLNWTTMKGLIKSLCKLTSKHSISECAKTQTAPFTRIFTFTSVKRLLWQICRQRPEGLVTYCWEQTYVTLRNRAWKQRPLLRLHYEWPLKRSLGRAGMVACPWQVWQGQTQNWEWHTWLLVPWGKPNRLTRKVQGFGGRPHGKPVWTMTATASAKSHTSF